MQHPTTAPGSRDIRCAPCSSGTRQAQGAELLCTTDTNSLPSVVQGIQSSAGTEAVQDEAFAILGKDFT